jgi:hypothetical protein
VSRSSLDLIAYRTHLDQEPLESQVVRMEQTDTKETNSPGQK